MTYKTFWLAGLLAPMLIAPSASAVEARVAGSLSHSVFIDGGDVYGMGQNTFGEIVTNGAVPVTQYRTPQFTGIQNAKSVAATQGRTAVLKYDGTVTVWGLLGANKYNSAVVLPMNQPASDVAITDSDVYYITNGEVFKWAFSTMTITKVSSFGIGTVKQIAAGNRHIIALLTNGTVATVGTNSAGQLGFGEKAAVVPMLTILPNVSDVIDVAAGAETSFARRSDKTLIAFGKNSRGELGFNTAVDQMLPQLVPNVVGVKKVVADNLATTLLMENGTLRAAGYHNFIGGTVYNTNKTFVELYGITNTVDVFAGGEQRFVITTNSIPGQLRGWGGNNTGKLGDGTITERHTLTYANYTPKSTPVVSTPVVSTPVTISPFGTPAPTPVVSTPKPVVPTPTPVVSTPVYQYTSMNDCLKANPKWNGKDCNSLIPPSQRGNGK